MEQITRDQLHDLFAQVGEVMHENMELLCEMDARMGDGDLGLTMNKGFNALPEVIDAIEEPDLGKTLVKAGMKMASVVPSTMGTLMASGLMGAGKLLAGRSAMDAGGLVLFLEGFCTDVIKRGKCAVGDRTLLDAMDAAHKSAAAAAATGADLAHTASAALDGARAGLEATKSMKPKFGKAAVFSAVAEGREDQGAYAGMLLMQGIADFINA